MKVSVVTTVYNDAEGLRALLASLHDQEPPFEVVVVDACSTDGTWQVVQDAKDAGMDVQAEQRAGPRGTGFRAAAELATGEVLAFIGADDRAAPGWVAAIRRAAQAGGDVLVGTNRLEGAAHRGRRVPWIVDGQDISHPGCNTSYRASVYHAVGGIDASFVTAEDMELNLRAVRAGHRIVAVPDAVVVRTVRPTHRGTLKQAYWNGYGRGQLRSKHGAVPGMKSGGLRVAANPLLWPRLAAGVLGFLAGRRSP